MHREKNKLKDCILMKHSSICPDDTGLMNPLVSQLSVDTYMDMDTGFANVLANGHVVGDSHTALGSLCPLFDISSAQRSDKRRRLTIPLASQLSDDPIVDLSVRVNGVPDVDICPVVRCCWCRKVEESCYRQHFG